MKDLMRRAALGALLLLALWGFIALADSGTPFGWLQRGMALSVCAIQGSPCVAEGNVLHYPEILFSIDFRCTGVDQALLFLVLSFAFHGVPRGRTATRLAIIAGAIIALNFLRVLLVYPATQSFGTRPTLAAHDFLYNYAQGAFVIALFIAHAYLAAKESPRAQRAKEPAAPQTTTRRRARRAR